MSKAKFSQGPWEIDDRGYGFAIEPSVCWIGENSSTTPEQLKANANLIAAAPEMYAELARIADVLEDPEDCGVISLDSINVILRKARGESEAQK